MTKWCAALALLALATIVVARTFDQSQFPKINLKPIKNTAERAREHGYPGESHYVETADNYVINVFRIPYSNNLNNKNEYRPAVLLQHGLFSCSESFVLSGPNDALAYMYADNGFDVWIGNARGNVYSRNNTRLSPNHPNFWAFSWHEIGVYDLPAVIDYILKETNQKAIHYAGHSQGSTSFFVMTSSLPEYNKKIKTAHMLAPPVFMSHTSHDLVHIFGPYVTDPTSTATKLLDSAEFVPSNIYVQRAVDTACGGDPAYPEYCRTLFMTWAGSEATNINTTLLPQIAETHPAGISTNQGIHYIQLAASDRFCQYDHGVKGNLKRYGQETPPDYDLSNVVAPMYLYYGHSDTSVNYTDVERIPPYLSNLKVFHKVPDLSWAHVDFIFGKYVKPYVNDLIIESSLEFERENPHTED